MKKLFLTFIFLLFPAEKFYAQLTIKPQDARNETFLYVNGNLLFVSGGINLEKNTGTPVPLANIYLRNQAQLIQGIKNSTNTGNGILSVFQEGTANAYEYNYWAAPIGNGADGNNFFGIGLLLSPQTEMISNPARHTPQLNGSANPLTISSRWIYTYRGKNYSDWKFIGFGMNIPPGYGFTMKGVAGTDPTVVNGRKNNPGGSQRYDFRGFPNSGTISIPVNPEQFVLIGNPYPSALDLSLFLIENSGSGSLSTNCYGTISRNNIITGIAYFWDSKEGADSHYLEDYVGGYGAFSPVDPCTTGIYEEPVFRSYGEEPETGLKGNFYERRFSPIAQGFMVEGAASGAILFQNSHRIFKKEGEHSEFKGSQDPSSLSLKELIVIPKIGINVEIDNEFNRQLTLGFWHNSTRQTDVAMDAKAFETLPTDAGWLQQKENFVIDVRPFSVLEEIPLYLKVEKERAKFTFKVQNLENFDPEQIFIHDTVTKQYHPVKNNSFQVSLERGEYFGRFRLSFRKNAQLREERNYEKEIPSEEIIVFQDNKRAQLTVENPTEVPIHFFGIYNLNGKEIFSTAEMPENRNFIYSTGNLSNSIYLLKIIKNDGTRISKKIWVKN